MKQKERKKLNKGITLIALVITIIVLLILAGVSIAMLTGQNGILTQAQKAGEQTEIGQEKEAIALAYNGAKAENNGGDVDADDLNRNFGYNDTDATAEGSNPITVTFKESGRQYTIDENGVISDPVEANIIASIRIEGEKVTTPPMPSSDFSYVEGSVDDGYVIKDGKGNEYVWVPVDKKQKIKVNVTSKEDITSITLTDPYGDTILTESNKGTSYTNNEIKPTINGPYVLKVTTANEEKTTVLGVHSLYKFDTMIDWMLTDEYFETDSAQSSMPGVTLETFLQQLGVETVEEAYPIMGAQAKGQFEEKEEYDTETSVKENGGFYIGRYEASDDGGSVAVKRNVTPENNISQIDALDKANHMYDTLSEKNFESSLLTGAAWDRTLGWLEETGAVRSIEIVGDSKTWGNYSDDEFENSEGLQNTGSIPQTEKNHIYDLAGNVREWTTEAESSDDRVSRGGYYSTSGSYDPCSIRNYSSPGSTDSGLGFRLALYL